MFVEGFRNIFQQVLRFHSNSSYAEKAFYRLVYSMTAQSKLYYKAVSPKKNPDKTNLLIRFKLFNLIVLVINTVHSQ